MLKFNVVRNSQNEIDHISTHLTGYDLLSTPDLNKGCAFSPEERSLFKLDGLLPHYTETLEQQVTRMYAQYSEHKTNISKNIYLTVLHDYNKTLFYKLISHHLEEMLPVIYTPTVGEAVERFSLELRKPQGLYLSYEDRNQISHIIEHSLPNHIDLIVVTDGEAVLGIGDQGVGGIKICNAKSMVYTLCAGIAPYKTFSVQLDVGTNNPALLNDPMYLGWRHERITGQAYDDFIDTFVNAIQKKLPYVYLHWEDVGRENASRILSHYRNKICTINGDMQSTGAITLACILAACTRSETPLTQHQIVILGAGTAGVGIANQIASAMQRKGLSQQDAYAKIWLIDKQGLLINDQNTLLPFQKPFARSTHDILNWKKKKDHFIGLEEVVQHVKPTILIGCSTQAGAFSESIIKTIAHQTTHPIIFPLSNPNSKAEATPEDIVKWTEGRAIIATGSPFPDLFIREKKVRVTQSNNAYAFPGIGLGAIAVKAKYLTDDMLWVATEALSKSAPRHQYPFTPLLPKLSETIAISQKIALAVAEQAQKEGLAQVKENDLNQLIRAISWQPIYYPYRKI